MEVLSDAGTEGATQNTGADSENKLRSTLHITDGHSPAWEGRRDETSGGGADRDGAPTSSGTDAGAAGGARRRGGGNGEGEVQDTLDGGATTRGSPWTVDDSYCSSNIDPLSILPDEIIVSILTYLDISDLFALIKTSHRLRTISLDPLLHRNRLLRTKHFLSLALPQRPPLEALRSPRRIWMSKRDFTGRQLSKRFLKIRLNRKLGARPDPGLLVERGVLPKRYLKKWKGEAVCHEGPCACPVIVERRENVCTKASIRPSTDQPHTHHAYTTQLQQHHHHHHHHLEHGHQPPPLSTSSSSHPPSSTTCYYTHLSPHLLTTCLTLEKQLLRDRLASFVRTFPPSLEQAQENLVNKHILPPLPPPHRTISPSPTRGSGISSLWRPSVRYLVTRFSLRAQQDPGAFLERESRWGRGGIAESRRRRRWERRERVGEEVDGAGRQNVAGLRRFYERLSRG